MGMWFVQGQDAPGYLDEKVEEVHEIEMKGILRKKVVVYGCNSTYSDIRILHDYETGEVIKESYDTLFDLEELHRHFKGEAAKHEEEKIEKLLTISKRTELEKKVMEGLTKDLWFVHIRDFPLSSFLHLLELADSDEANVFRESLIEQSQRKCVRSVYSYGKRKTYLEYF